VYFSLDLVPLKYLSRSVGARRQIAAHVLSRNTTAYINAGALLERRETRQQHSGVKSLLCALIGKNQQH
jgi:hypothetical protein